MLVLFFTLAAAVVAPKHYDYDDDHIEGDIVSAEGAVTTSAPRPKRTSLIRVRTHFLDELVRSGDR